MENKTEILQPDTFYHIYNRANGNENIFTSNENYSFFLNKYKQYLSPICNTYCYCLMPNHFHFLIEIKSEKELIDFFIKEKPNLSESFSNPTFPKYQTLEKLTSKQFSNFFSCYTQAFNKQQGRKGSLFMKNFKRKKITTKEYLIKLVHYIHYNPIEASLCKKVSEWNFSSFNSLLSTSTTLLEREKVIDWFDDKDNFIFIHKHKPKELNIVFD
jgi:putative transposase